MSCLYSCYTGYFLRLITVYQQQSVSEYVLNSSQLEQYNEGKTEYPNGVQVIEKIIRFKIRETFTDFQFVFKKMMDLEKNLPEQIDLCTRT